MTDHLIGYWVIDAVEEHATEHYGKVYLRFMEDGLVQWGYAKPDKICVQSFYYRIKDGVVVTVLSPNPREERTPYLITPDGKLKLSYSYYDTLWARTTEQAFFTKMGTGGSRIQKCPGLITWHTFANRPTFISGVRRKATVCLRSLLSIPMPFGRFGNIHERDLLLVPPEGFQVHSGTRCYSQSHLQ